MEWKDRVPSYPNRRKITYEDGRVEYVTIEMADEPIETGTPLNKANFERLANYTVPVVGSYSGNNATQEFNLGFKPSVVIICRIENNLTNELMILTKHSKYDSHYGYLTDNGFAVGQTYSNHNFEYQYVAWRDINE